MKRVPSFWWDFDYDPERIIVQSNDPKYPIVKAYDGHTTNNIYRAEKLIIELEEGRTNMKKEK